MYCICVRWLVFRMSRVPIPNDLSFVCVCVYCGDKLEWMGTNVHTAQLITCSKGLLDSVRIEDMSKLYTCGISEVGKMRRGGECVDEGQKHLHGIPAWHT